MDEFQLKVAEELFKTLKTNKEKAAIIRKCYYSFDTGIPSPPIIPIWAAKKLQALVTRDLQLPDYMLSTIWVASRGINYE